MIVLPTCLVCRTALLRLVGNKAHRACYCALPQGGPACLLMEFSSAVCRHCLMLASCLVHTNLYTLHTATQLRVPALRPATSSVICAGRCIHLTSCIHPCDQLQVGIFSNLHTSTYHSWGYCTMAFSVQCIIR
jgi:hypothetical protein